MHKFFVEGDLSGDIYLSPDDVRHVKNVLRLKPGDLVRVAGDGGGCAEARIVSFDGGAARLAMVRLLPRQNEAAVNLMLGQGLLKGGKMDLVCQKAAELGARAILPVALQHSVTRYEEKKGLDRQARWQKIAREGAQQCGRDAPPAVWGIQSLAEAIAAAGACELKLLFYEAEQVTFLRPLLKTIAKPPASVFVLIGPEGGFSGEEARQAVEAGFVSVSLGYRVLRAETAALTALAVLMYEWGGLEAAYD